MTFDSFAIMDPKHGNNKKKEEEEFLHHPQNVQLHFAAATITKQQRWAKKKSKVIHGLSHQKIAFIIGFMLLAMKTVCAHQSSQKCCDFLLFFYSFSLFNLHFICKIPNREPTTFTRFVWKREVESTKKKKRI